RARVLRAVEVEHRLAQAEVACRPGVGPGEMTREEPLRRPLADAGEGGQRCFHVVIRESGNCPEVEVAAGDADRVLGLSAGKTEREDLLRLGERDSLPGWEGVRETRLVPEGLDETVAHGKRRLQRHLLRPARGG